MRNTLVVTAGPEAHLLLRGGLQQRERQGWSEERQMAEKRGKAMQGGGSELQKGNGQLEEWQCLTCDVLGGSASRSPHARCPCCRSSGCCNGNHGCHWKSHWNHLAGEKTVRAGQAPKWCTETTGQGQYANWQPRHSWPGAPNKLARMDRREGVAHTRAGNRAGSAGGVAVLRAQAGRGAGARVGALVGSFLEEVVLQGVEGSDATAGLIVQHAQHQVLELQVV